MSQPAYDDYDDEIEQFERTWTANLSLDFYDGGDLSTVTVEVVWERGERSPKDNVNDDYVSASYRAKAKFNVSNGEATLTGFYPETNATGEQLWGKTLRCLRCLPHAAEAAESVEEVDTVVAPVETVLEQIEQ